MEQLGFQLFCLLVFAMAVTVGVVVYHICRGTAPTKRWHDVTRGKYKKRNKISENDTKRKENIINYAHFKYNRKTVDPAFSDAEKVRRKSNFRLS